MQIACEVNGLKSYSQQWAQAPTTVEDLFRYMHTGMIQGNSGIEMFAPVAYDGSRASTNQPQRQVFPSFM